MLSSVQPKVKGVAGVVLVAPKPFSFLKIKSATGGAGARRALAALGPNNAKHNMDMAKSHLANVQEVFSNRWNFNPVKEVPLAGPGRFQWTPLIGGNTKDTAYSHSPVVEKDIAKPALESVPSSVISKVTDLQVSTQDVQDSKFTQTNPTVDQENSENEIKTENKLKQQVKEPNNETTAVPMKNVTSNSQNCIITDFFREKKRKSGYIHDACIPCPNTPPKKKSRAIH